MLRPHDIETLRRVAGAASDTVDRLHSLQVHLNKIEIQFVFRFEDAIDVQAASPTADGRAIENHVLDHPLTWLSPTNSPHILETRQLNQNLLLSKLRNLHATSEILPSSGRGSFTPGLLIQCSLEKKPTCKPAGYVSKDSEICPVAMV